MPRVGRDEGWAGARDTAERELDGAGVAGEELRLVAGAPGGSQAASDGFCRLLAGTGGGRGRGTRIAERCLGRLGQAAGAAPAIGHGGGQGLEDLTVGALRFAGRAIEIVVVAQVQPEQEEQQEADAEADRDHLPDAGRQAEARTRG